MEKVNVSNLRFGFSNNLLTLFPCEILFVCFIRSVSIRSHSIMRYDENVVYIPHWLGEEIYNIIYIIKSWWFIVFIINNIFFMGEWKNFKKKTDMKKFYGEQFFWEVFKIQRRFLMIIEEVN